MITITATHDTLDQALTLVSKLTKGAFDAMKPYIHNIDDFSFSWSDKDSGLSVKFSLLNVNTPSK